MKQKDLTRTRMRIEVMRAGWVRLDMEVTPDGPRVKWVQPGTRPRRALITEDPDTLPMGVREAARARMVREEVAEVDPWRLQLVPGFAQTVMTNGVGVQAEVDPYVILHRLDCAAAARWFDRAVGAASN